MKTDDNSDAPAIRMLAVKSALDEVATACQHDLAFLDEKIALKSEPGLLATWNAIGLASIYLERVGLAEDACLLRSEGKKFFRLATDHLLCQLSACLSEDLIAQLQESAGQFPVMPSDPAEVKKKRDELTSGYRKFGAILCRHVKRIQVLLTEGKEPASVEPAAPFGAGAPGERDFDQAIDAKIPPEYRSVAMTKKRAVGLLRSGNPESGVKWLNACIQDGTASCEEFSRQSYVFDLREFPERERSRIKPVG